MSEFISLTCPSCGSKLKITDDIDRFACRSCGNEFIVNRGEGIVTLKPLVEGLGKIQKGVDKTASELAIVRLQDEIMGLNNRLDTLKNERENVNISLYLTLLLLSIFIGFIAFI
jgi:transposase-like protein